ncbi:hypothetical protein EDE04_0024 [Streptomyces sp. 2132.2]|uniref:hypothetical protein n=1 Tax=Streptomyces sp. 2132.2 TaxID=2485161 RepID=UPI000FB8B00A|nr:hypothetical protein [Streptomyces sp. 2132.2]ROQ93639.1 hypothetical protein EDE04_0024 [Streptomyces sp. 2132.2]
MAEQKPDEARTAVAVTMYDSEGSQVQSVMLNNAKATGITGSLHHASAGEAVTIAYEFLTIE